MFYKKKLFRIIVVLLNYLKYKYINELDIFYKSKTFETKKLFFSIVYYIVNENSPTYLVLMLVFKKTSFFESYTTYFYNLFQANKILVEVFNFN